MQVKPGTDGKTVIANIAWRGGYTDYNGFYESTDGGNTWHMVQTQGINAAQIGRSSFAYATNGRLYAVVESIHKYLVQPRDGTDGRLRLAVRQRGRPVAPGRRLARSSGTLRNALGFGFGYSPGIQTWYDQFVGVDPDRPNHVYVGLEEVFESTNGGQRWVTVGPYWNFGLPVLRGRRADELPADHAPRPARDRLRRRAVWLGNDGGSTAGACAARLVVEPQRRPAHAAVLLRRRRGTQRRRARLLGRPAGQRRIVPAHGHVDDGVPVRR